MDLRTDYGVYIIINEINLRVYVGKGVRRKSGTCDRWRAHAKNASLIGSAIRHHGIQNFTFGWISHGHTEAEANEREIKQIAFWKSNVYRHGNDFGYNLTDGGEGTSGRIISSEFRDFCSDFQKNRLRLDSERIAARDRITKRNQSTPHMRDEKHRKRMRDVLRLQNPMHKPEVYQRMLQRQRHRTPQLKNAWENAWLIYQLREDGMKIRELWEYFEVTRATINKIVHYFRLGKIDA